MIEIGRRRRSQPAPPHVIFEALCDPDRDPSRPWLMLQHDELRPTVLLADPPAAVTWSTLWLARSDATVAFQLPLRADGGTDLQWTLLVADPVPDEPFVGHMRKRLNQLINANLRYTFGQ